MVETAKIAIYSKIDPTRTTTLRNAFVAALKRRFNELARVVRRAVDEEDVFGLRGQPQTFQMGTPGAGRFAFATSQGKVNAFMEWIEEQQRRGILEIREYRQAGAAVNDAWTNRFVYDSYKRGAIRARYELRKAGFAVPPTDQVGGVEMIMNSPFHMDRLGVLYSRVFSELRGITAAMDQQISRVLTQGMADGDGPRLLARKLVGTINGTGMGDLGLTDTLGRFIPARRRAEIMARTEIVRAHHQATIQEYENWGAEGVTVQAEWQTAGDERVCATCASMQGEVYTLDQIQNMIPRHPQCRCMALPYRKGMDTPQRWNDMPAVRSGRLPTLENVK